MTTAKTAVAICVSESELYLLFLSDQQKIHFLVSHRILVISFCVPWDEKGWKSRGMKHVFFEEEIII